ncbi:MAG TPA: ParB/RepB/Spo0J family partition protein [Candidatus Nitrosocosmicus sp.]|jgi:ParB family transcriptional regulator, chromosome partitioning protein|nr:ParB/RepB/Spo0J family partition protein [Candidatus Nitrosocosmicus sp.]
MATMLNNGSRLFGEIENILIANIRVPSNNLRISNCLNIEKIANSIRQHGLLQPLVVKPRSEHFEIVAGYRRFLACKSLHWKKIPCHIVNLDDMQTFEVAMVENIRRKSFTPLEEANAFKIYVSDRGWGGITELSNKIGRSQSSIIRRIGLLDLPKDVIDSIKRSQLSPSTAVELFRVKDPIKQSHLAKLVARQHLTTKRVRGLVNNEMMLYNQQDTIIRSQLRAFDKSIIVLRVALNKIATIIEEENKDNILIHELLLYQRNMLHDQIGVLLKCKKKYERKILRYRNFVK